MTGGDITRDVALRVLRTMEREAMQSAKMEHAQLKQTSPGAYAYWVDKFDERLAVIEGLMKMVESLPAAAVLVPGEAVVKR